MKYVIYVLVGIVALMLIVSGFFKIQGSPMVVESFTKIHLETYRVFLGVLEFVIAALFIYPLTRTIGFFLLCSYLGGAIAITLSTGESPMAAIVILTLGWIAMYLHKPSLFLKN